MTTGNIAERSATAFVALLVGLLLNRTIGCIRIVQSDTAESCGVAEREGFEPTIRFASGKPVAKFGTDLSNNPTHSAFALEKIPQTKTQTKRKF